MIYLVEDDNSIRNLVVYTLNNSGFEAIGFEDSRLFWREVDIKLPELVLLDIMLPGEDGLQILKKLRFSSNTVKIPVIMLTAKDSEYDKVVGLDSGADDYISKPFGIMELISRIRAVLRRNGEIKKSGGVHRVGEIEVDIDKHEVKCSGKLVALTFKEFELLSCLLENIGRVMTRDILLEKIWGYDFDGETRTVDVHIGTLRNKLGEHGELIETVRGVGYRIGSDVLSR